ncbi:MAG TPA: CAP domain-containing protein [Thermoanaerobaculia bacterium]|nr:CAP domain-containing protein [Thermoanaerobaculia bacterium]
MRRLPLFPLRRLCTALLLLTGAPGITIPAGGAGAAGGDGGAVEGGRLASKPPGARPAEPDKVRGELLLIINEERRAAGASDLRLSAALNRAAQQHADEIGQRGSLRAEPRAEDSMDGRLKEAGYEAHEWTESVTSGPEKLADVLPAWKEYDREGTFRKLLDPDYRDLGIGLGRLDGAPLYTFLFAVPAKEAFARQTAGLRDLSRVRAEMLTKVNAVRKHAGVGPLTVDSRLDEAAQRHAEDMLKRSYFAHQSPDGKSVRERARATGYNWATIGENLAEGQTTVDEVVDSWMHSRAHRENLLDGRFTQLGLGLAFGRDPRTGSYRILWVQNLGRPR